MGVEGVSSMSDIAVWTSTKNRHGARALARAIPGVGPNSVTCGTTNCGSRRYIAAAKNSPKPQMIAAAVPNKRRNTGRGSARLR